MSYRIYHTEGFILSSREINEDSRLLRVLTPDLGAVTVMGQGTRKARSKLRPHLQDLSHGQMSLVRGREFWRLIGIERSRLVTPIMSNLPTLTVWARLGLLLRRLLRGEGEQQALFNDVKTAAQFLPTLETPEALADFELVITLRILHQLGYATQKPAWRSGLSDQLRATFKQEVVSSLAASQL